MCTNTGKVKGRTPVNINLQRKDARAARKAVKCRRRHRPHDGAGVAHFTEGTANLSLGQPEDMKENSPGGNI